MKREYLRLCQDARAAIFVLGLIFLLSVLSPAQGIRRTDPNLERRKEVGKQIEENNRILMDSRKLDKPDEKVKLTKEERHVLVNEAFKRLQILHNEILEMIKAGKVLNFQLVRESAYETRSRADQLHRHLSLPRVEDKDKKQNKGEKPAVPAAADLLLNESLSELCAMIQSFVVNVNKSPNDRKAGGQARRELENIIELSSKIVFLTTPKDETNK
jgi:hypothetical protein